MRDRILDRVPYKKWGPILVNRKIGWGKQIDLYDQLFYNQAYFDKYLDYESLKIADSLNRFRWDLVHGYARGVLDVGIGAGTFLKGCSRPWKGFDICPSGRLWLKNNKAFFDPYRDEWPDYLDCVTFFDSLEHLACPSVLFSRIPRWCKVIVSLPIVPRWNQIKLWRHYRPGEHLRYFKHQGIVEYFARMGYRTALCTARETEIGRQDIRTYVFEPML